MYDTYVKIKDNGKEIKRKVIDLPFYCTCPCCGKEIELPEYFELITQNEDFDPFEMNLYCDKCNDKTKSLRQSIKNLIDVVDIMPMDKLREVYGLMARYYMTEDDE